MTNRNPGYLRLILIVNVIFFLTNVKAQNVISFYPERNSTNADAGTQISVRFDSTVNQNTINSKTFAAYGSYTGLKAGTYEYAADENKVIFTPDKPFLKNEMVSVTITKGILTLAGDSLEKAKSWSFQIKPAAGSLYFFKTTIFCTNNGNNFALLDSDLDGDLDIAIGHAVMDMSDLYNRSELGEYVNVKSIPGKISAITDFNKTGYPDLLTIKLNRNYITPSDYEDYWFIYLGANMGLDGFITYTIPHFPYFSNALSHVIPIDLDVDGDTDLITNSYKIFNDDSSSESGYSYTHYIKTSQDLQGKTLDIDYDGDIDIVRLNGRILLNDSEGNFFESMTIPQNDDFQFANISPGFNLELLCMNKYPPGISIYTYDSLFNFTEYSSLSLYQKPKGMTLADANGDGFLDIFVFYNNSPELDLFLNTGSGTFQYESTITAAGNIQSVAAGDFDFDGDLDVACLLESSPDMEIFNNVESAPQIGLSQSSFNFGMSGLTDSKRDTLKIYNYSYESDLILKKLENGQNVFTINAKDTIIHPGDTLNLFITFTPDKIKGYRDTLKICSNDPLSPVKLISLSGDGGSFDVDVTPAHHSIITVKPEFQIKFNFDLDQRTLNNGLFLRGNQSGTQKNWQLTYSQTTRIATIRTNSDFLAGEKVTLLLSSHITSRINTPFDPGTLNFTVNTTETGNGFFKKLSALPVENIKKVYPADLNNDGFTDLVAVRNDKKISVLLNNGSGSFTLSESINHYGKDQPPFVMIADFDNDGDVDIAAIEQEYAGRMDDYIRIYLNDGQGLFQNKQISSHIGQCTYSTGIYARDINQDGFVDVATLGMSDAFVIYINEGTAHFQSLNYVSILERTASRLKFADWDNDYDFDLTDHKGKLFENKNGHFKYNKDLGLEVKNLDFADFDGDNDLDLATVSGQLNIWSNDGSGTFSQTRLLQRGLSKAVYLRIWLYSG